MPRHALLANKLTPPMGGTGSWSKGYKKKWIIILLNERLAWPVLYIQASDPIETPRVIGFFLGMIGRVALSFFLSPACLDKTRFSQ